MCRSKSLEECFPHWMGKITPLRDGDDGLYSSLEQFENNSRTLKLKKNISYQEKIKMFLESLRNSWKQCFLFWFAPSKQRSYFGMYTVQYITVFQYWNVGRGTLHLFAGCLTICFLHGSLWYIGTVYRLESRHRAKYFKFNPLAPEIFFANFLLKI